MFKPLAAWLKGRGLLLLKVFKPADEPNEPVTDAEVDRILTKIHREGEQSLTAKERRVMEKASRQYQRRRQARSNRRRPRRKSFRRHRRARFLGKMACL